MPTRVNPEELNGPPLAVEHAPAGSQRMVTVRRPLTDLPEPARFNVVETVNDKAVVFLPWNTIEPEAQQQILNTASMPFVFKHVAVMPDCHYGKGATVGTVLATQGAVIPAAVGVDIGCGMIAVRTPLERADIAAPSAVRAGIERRIPMNAGKNNTKLTATAAERVRTLEVLAKQTRATSDEYDRNGRLALGTLGGGNHFIELAEDGDGRRLAHIALRLPRRGQQDWQSLHQGGATALRVNGSAPS